MDEFRKLVARYWKIGDAEYEEIKEFAESWLEGYEYVWMSLGS
jgi:hypothetical protein